jgi:hypothetical protein
VTGRAGYFFAPIPVIAGFAVAGWLVWSAIDTLQDAFTRFVAPGSVTLTLSEPGTYTIFHEPESVIDGKLYAAPGVDGLQVTVTAEADPDPIPVIVPTMSSRYTIGGRTGRSVLAFDIGRPGRYRLAAAYDGGRSEPRTVLAVGRGFFSRLLLTIAGAIAVVFTGAGVALALVLTTYFRRRGDRRRAQAVAF